jgi:2,3,4,5-tetrahydropyridine-2-carboxylate N-succinyltransferase
MSTKIMDANTGQELERGVIPPRSVVIPGNMKKEFAGGEFYVPCALIIGQRKPSTDPKTSLNDALREFNVAV